VGQLQIKRFKEILERMRNRVVARTDLTDLLDTSSVNQVLSAAAREDDDQWFTMAKLLDIFDVDTAIGPDLDELAKTLNPDLLVRDRPRKATGAAVFSRTGTVGTVTISQGSEIQVPGTNAVKPIKFTTTAEGQILNGFTTSSPIPIVASEAGSAWNTTADTITAFGSKPSGVDSVSNPTSLTNGRDLETDDQFRTRIKLFVRSLSRATRTALIYAALTAEDVPSGKRVVFAAIVEDETNLGNVTLYIDDGAGTVETGAVTSVIDQVVLAAAVGGEVDLYLTNRPVKIENTFTVKKNTVVTTAWTFNPASGHLKMTVPLTPGDLITCTYSYWTGLIAECQKIVDGDPVDRVGYPGYRAAGVLVRALAPAVVQMAVSANITVRSGYSQTDVAAKAKAAILDYINALGIGEDVIRQELVERAMGVPGAYDILVINPSANRVVLDTQLARLSSTNITIN